MEKTKHPYLKDILKTTAKVALIAGVTLVATPYTFGFAAGLINSIWAGYAAGAVTFGLGAWCTGKTLFKDIVTMRGRVKKQQQEEELQARLQAIEEKLEKLQVKEINLPEKESQEEVKVPQRKKPLRRGKFNPMHWRRFRQYDRAA